MQPVSPPVPMVTPIGSFVIESGRITIFDPCYEPDDPANHAEVPVQPGVWHAAVDHDNGRVYALFARHEHCRKVSCWSSTHNLPVDSGQLAIVDATALGPNTSRPPGFYDLACHLTRSPFGAGVGPHLVVSDTGWGDGYYQARIGYDNDNKPIAIEILFINEAECDICGGSRDYCSCPA